MRLRFSADLYGFLLWLGFVLLVFWLLPLSPITFITQLDLAWRWFIALNIATLLLFGFDKLSAQVGLRRIPERLLYLATFLGGSIGALIAMYVFRHKTRKMSFQLVIALLILIQIALVLWL